MSASAEECPRTLHCAARSRFSRSPPPSPSARWLSTPGRPQPVTCARDVFHRGAADRDDAVRSAAMRIFWMVVGAFAIGCGSSPAASTSEASAGGESTVVIEEDDPRVSRSAGEEGGVVVLYPRVMGLPEGEAERLQAHMVELVRRIFPNRKSTRLNSS